MEGQLQVTSGNGWQQPLIKFSVSHAGTLTVPKSSPLHPTSVQVTILSQAIISSA
jgi:hypothetical protein